MKFTSKTRRLLAAASFGFATLAASAETLVFPVGTAVPDGNPTGLANAQSVSSGITSIQSVRVSLDLSGGFNGDLYAYLVHDTGFSVLLNRSGVTGSNPFGYTGVGFSVVFDDLAMVGLNPADIHNYESLGGGGSPVTGLWQPDGRAVSPNTVTDSDARFALLSGFNGLDANGTWTLFVADLNRGEQATLNQWSLEITGVPESSTCAMFTAVALLGLGVWKRPRQGSRVTPST